MRKVGAMLLAACGAHASGPTIGNQAPRAAGAVVRLDAKHPTVACPAGTLAAIAKGWHRDDDSELYTDGAPQLDACLAGRFGAPGIVVFASAPPPSDSQTELATPGRELIVDPDGKPRLEGPPTAGSWMTGPPTLDGLADLDGDGVDEIVVREALDPGNGELHVLRVTGSTLADVGTAPLWGEDCDGSWKVKDGALIVHLTSSGSDGAEVADGTACVAGDHTYKLVGGALTDVDPPPPPDDD